MGEETGVNNFMNETFTINRRCQLKSIHEGLLHLAVLPVGLLIVLLSGKINLGNLQFFLSIVGLIYLALFSPAIYLHLTYLLDNWNTTLTVDRTLNEILIKTDRGDFKYQYDDIKKTELNLGIYYKNKIDKRGRWTATWTGYGYLKLKFKDEKEFHFTSLMLDLDKLPFPVIATRFRFLPYIDKNQIDYKSIKTHNDNLKQEKIAEYQEKFNELADEKLLEKLNNPTRFEFEARKAAENILERRKKLLDKA